MYNVSTLCLRQALNLKINENYTLYFVSYPDFLCVVFKV